MLPPEDHLAHDTPAEHIHIFFECADGSYLAFFDLPSVRPTGADTGVPVWVSHIAFEVENMEVLLEGKQHLEAAGYATRGPQDHGFWPIAVLSPIPTEISSKWRFAPMATACGSRWPEEAEQNLAAWNARKAQKAAAKKLEFAK